MIRDKFTEREYVYGSSAALATIGGAVVLAYTGEFGTDFIAGVMLGAACGWMLSVRDLINDEESEDDEDKPAT